LGDVSAFAQLTEVPGDLMIGHFVGPTIYSFGYGVENIITKLHGLHNIEQVGGDLTIGDVNIPNLDELDVLSHIGGTLSLVDMGAALSSLHAPPALSQLGGFSVSASSELARIDFAVSTITGDIAIADGFRLVSVQFPTLTTLGGRLWLDRMNGYTDDEPNHISFPVLSHAGGIELLSMGALSRLAAFPSLMSIDDDLYVMLTQAQMPNWKTEIFDFNRLETIGGDLTIVGYDLSALDAFSLLTDVGGDVSLTGTVKGNPARFYNKWLGTPSVTTFGALSSAQKLVIGAFDNLPPCWAQNLADQLWPEGTDAVTDLWGLPTCTNP
jgi:hypothetical protein